MVVRGYWIDGREEQGSGEDARVTAPYNGEVIAEFKWTTPKDVNKAVASSVHCFRNTMKRMPAHERAAILRRAADLADERAEELAQIICWEGGKPIRFARAEAKRVSEIFRFAAEEARRLGGEIVPMDASPGGEGRMGFALRVPLGVVAAISPFNAPLNLSVQKVAPAIAAGCTVVLKPSKATPLTALAIGKLMTDAGAPPGACNVITGGRDSVSALVKHPDVSVVSFTGSTTVGEQIRAVASYKKVLLELGSNAPNIVCPSADLDAAAKAIVQAGFHSSGQICVSAQRVYVHESIWEEFMIRLLDEVAKLKVGDPRDPETDVGPLINREAVERIAAWIDEAVSQGAQILAGGTSEGPHVMPTVITGVKQDMKVVCQEIFGPVITVSSFKEIGEAIDLANDSIYGLQAGVFTRDVNEAFLFARELEYGSIWINDASRYRQDNTPFGGFKQSGLGREGVHYAVEEMTETKFVGLKLA